MLSLHALKKADRLKNHFIQKWQLLPDGQAFHTNTALLQPVLYKSKKALLKISVEPEEQYGGLLMQWWDGIGAVPVYEYEREALLMERISSKKNLTALVEEGNDDDGTLIICKTADELHKERNKPLPELIDLNDWFSDLLFEKANYGSNFVVSSKIAQQLLESTINKTVLHGDLHHENILYADDKRGWLAIDPKRLYGDKAFEYANLFCNPNAKIALTPGRMQQQLSVVCNYTGISYNHLLQWIVAWTALSAIWMLKDGADASDAVALNTIALEKLNT